MPKEKPTFQNRSPPLAVLNTFEAAKDHFQHYKPTFGSIFAPSKEKSTFGRPSFRIEAHLWQSWKPRSLEAFSGCKGRIEAHQRKKLKEYLQKYCKDTQKAHK